MEKNSKPASAVTAKQEPTKPITSTPASTPGATAETKPTATVEPKPEVKPTPEPERGGKPKSVKEIIDTHIKLESLFEKREVLNEAVKKLDSFNLGSAKMQDSLSIKDGKNGSFSTSNTDLIETTVNFLKAHAEKKMIEVEAEICAIANS